MSTANVLDELLADELRSLHVAETELSRIHPRMSAAADHQVLVQLFARQTETAKGRIARLEESLAHIGRSPRRRTASAIVGLAGEARAAYGTRNELIRDARLVGSAQRLSHHKMAAYGNARGLAQAVGQYAISNFLQHAYDDEAETARQLETLSAILYQEVVAFSAVAHASAPLGAARTSAA